MNDEEQKRIQEIQNRYKDFDINSNQNSNQNNYQSKNTSYEEFKQQKEERQSVYQENIYKRGKNNFSGMGMGTAIFVTLLTLFIIGTTSAYYLGVFDSFKKENTQIQEQKENVSDDSKIEKVEETKISDETAKQEKVEEVIIKKNTDKEIKYKDPKENIKIINTTYYSSNGKKKSEEFLINGELTSKIWLPNGILYAWKDKNTRVVNYFTGEKMLKEEKRNGKIYSYEWYKNGSLHASKIETSTKKPLEEKIYYKSGEILAVKKADQSVCYSKSGTIISDEDKCLNLLLENSINIFDIKGLMNLEKNDIAEMNIEFERLMPTKKEIKIKIDRENKKINEYNKILSKYSLDMGCSDNKCVKCNIIDKGRIDYPELRISENTQSFTMRETLKLQNGTIWTDDYEKEYPNWDNSHTLLEKLKFDGMYLNEIRECIEYDKNKKEIIWISTNELNSILNN